jgi:hypothetical protein
VNVELESVPSPGRPVLGNKHLTERNSKQSMKVRINELESYMENAVRTKLFQQQHEV